MGAVAYLSRMGRASEGYKRKGRFILMKGIIASIVTVLIVFLGLDFLFLPAWNVSSAGFWVIILISMIAGLICVIVQEAKKEEKGKKRKNLKRNSKDQDDKMKNLVVLAWVEIAAAGICVAVIVFGALFSSKLFHAKTYREIIQVENVDFADILKEDENISDIAIMDTETAQIIGKRALGSITELVSQYEVSEDYSTISYQNNPVKVAPLEYGSILKYFMNKDTGIPGYVLVDPVKNTAQYVALAEPVRYAPSAVFEYDLLRHIRSKYKTAILEDMYFEIDEAGKPFWICPVMKNRAGIFGARTVKGVILVDACSGEMEYVDVTEVPQWVDRVYDGDLLCGYYDSYGTLQSGFWNSVFGNKNCTVTTEDYGYKIIDDDVWIYTGVTSVSSDESNIGFLLMNQRTMKTYYFSCAGAEEFSAMSAAEGMVQDLGYTAAFPSIINVSGIPTYLMCLKDGSGLVKMYALVNVEQYNLVGTGVTQAEALKAYKTVLSQNGVNITDNAQGEEQTAEITVSELQFIQSDGETVVYIKSESGECYKMNFRDCEELILLNAGDVLKITYLEAENSSIRQLTGFEVTGSIKD